MESNPQQIAASRHSGIEAISVQIGKMVELIRVKNTPVCAVVVISTDRTDTGLAWWMAVGNH